MIRGEYHRENLKSYNPRRNILYTLRQIKPWGFKETLLQTQAHVNAREYELNIKSETIFKALKLLASYDVTELEPS